MERHKGGKGTERDERDNQESEKERDRETKERGKGEQKAHVNLMRKSTAPYAHNVLVWRLTITYQNPNLNRVVTISLAPALAMFDSSNGLRSRSCSASQTSSSTASSVLPNVALTISSRCDDAVASAYVFIADPVSCVYSRRCSAKAAGSWPALTNPRRSNFIRTSWCLAIDAASVVLPSPPMPCADTLCCALPLAGARSSSTSNTCCWSFGLRRTFPIRHHSTYMGAEMTELNSQFDVHGCGND